VFHNKVKLTDAHRQRGSKEKSLYRSIARARNSRRNPLVRVPERGMSHSALCEYGMNG
jgi:hypothetical protein